MSCDLGKATEGLVNEVWRRWSDGKVGEWALLIYLYICELCSFSNLSVTSPTSQLILQPFRCFTYVTVHSPTLLSLILRHKLFTWFTWQAAHATTSHNIGHFCFSHYEQVYRTKKVCISGHMFIALFLLFWWVLPPLKIVDTSLTLCIYSLSSDTVRRTSLRHRH